MNSLLSSIWNKVRKYRYISNKNISLKVKTVHYTATTYVALRASYTLHWKQKECELKLTTYKKLLAVNTGVCKVVVAATYRRHSSPKSRITSFNSRNSITCERAQNNDLLHNTPLPVWRFCGETGHSKDTAARPSRCRCLV
jgi:hypothetical protein